MKFRPAAFSVLSGFLFLFLFSSTSFADCNSPHNKIVAENCLPGNPASDWDITGAGDPSIQGFATDISVNAGQQIDFKIKTDATAYTIDIYRLGYYQGNGARLITNLTPTARLPQSQPDCLTDAATKLVDCGDWNVSASWQVPADAVSGIYVAHLIRSDTRGDSHILFVVREDGRSSDVLLQTADETWQAYNGYGGSSLYGPDLGFDINDRAYKVSYNRPFDTRAFGQEAATWFFGAEFPMVQWLEQNGYDVAYFTGVDAARNGNLITHHKIYLSVGHDEYWSGEQRANVEGARDAGVNLAFFSGNEAYWKTRWEADGSGTAYRTLVCYKETFDGQIIDPSQPNIWTGTWRDARFSPPADGGRPENALTGTSFEVNGIGDDNNGTLSIKVPASDGKMRFWRNTGLATQAQDAIAALPEQTLGYEWDVDADNGARPAGLIHLSSATYPLKTDLLLDEGATFGAGTATHHMTLYRAASGAMVFGAGTIQWSWGLSSNHDDPFGSQQSENKDMQQATANLLADMGVQPGSLQSNLIPATASTDNVPPASAITWPTNGTTVAIGTPVIVSGTATDSGGGVVGGVELSVDGGLTWHPATGRENWSYSWTPKTLGSFTLKSRATDDSVRTEVPASGISVVTVNPADCPCTNFSSSSVPDLIDSSDGNAVELGVRFRADFPGYITGIRFYKANTNTGMHIGNLWSNTGTLLASAIFTDEANSGWQQVNFSRPIAIAANTTYVASYFAPVGHYSATSAAFANTGIDTPPIHFLPSGLDGLNGVFAYGGVSTFPVSSFHATNYWVDVVYIPASSMSGASPAILLNPSALSFTAAASGMNPPPPQNVSVYNEGDGILSWTATSSAPWLIASPSSGATPSTLQISVDTSGLTAGTYKGTVTVTSDGATNPPQTISVSLTVSNVLLFSDFRDGTMGGWAFSPLGLATNWSVANNALQYNGAGHTQVYAGDAAWSDYSVSAAIKLATGNDFPGGIRGRVDPISGAGYTAWMYPAEGVIKLFQNSAWNIDSGFVLLGQASARFDTTNFHTLQLAFTGNHIEVLYDGNVVISVTDSARSSGLIALDVSTQVISFTNVTVTSTTPNADSLSSGSNSLNFAAAAPDSNPVPQTLTLTSTGGAVVWTATSNVAWLSLSPAYGTTPADLEVSVASSNLAPGTYSGSIKVVSLGVVNTTQTIPVSLTVGTSLASQSITITSAIPAAQAYNTSFSVSATGGGSGNAVSFALDASSTACSIGAVANASGTFTAAITMTSGTGNCVVDLNQSGNANYRAATQVQFSVAAAKADQATLTVTGPASATYGGSTTATVSGGSGTGALTFSAGASTGCSVNGTTLTVTNASGSCSLTATEAADNNYSQTSSAPFTVALGKANAVITVVPYNMTYDGQAHTATGTALGVESAPQDLSSLLSLTNTTHTNAGSYKGDAWSFAGNNNYNAASGTVDDNIAQATSSVSVTFEAGPYVYRGAAFTATAQVNGTTVSVPVSYSGDCSNVTTANGCTATATYVGDANHAANTGTSSITIMKANAKITVTGYNVTYDGHVHTATGIALGVEGAPANLSSLLSLNNTSHTNAGSYKGDVWSFAGNNNYNAANGTVDDNIVQVLPIITWSNPADIVSGTPLGATQLNATANVNGIFVYTPPASTVLNAGSGQTLSVTFTPSDAADYAPASASVSINVLNTATGTNVAAQAGDTSITFSNVTAPGMTNAMLINPSTAGQVPDSYVLDSTLAYDVTTTATFSGPVQVCFTVTAVTDPDVFSTLRVLHGENGILVDRTILAPDSPAADFSAKRVCARVDSLSPFAIARVTDITPPTIVITAPRATAYALNQSVTASYSCTDSGSGVDSCKGTVDNGSGIDTSSAGQKTFTVTATDKTRNTATETVNYTVNKGDPTITWTNPADIVYGTALSSTQLNATSNLPGTFAYTPVSGTVLKAGAQALSVTFTPNDPKNYNTATRTVTINVSKATPVITWANPGDITTGTPLSSIQLNATASVAGSFVYTPAAGTVLKGGSGQTLSVTFTPTDTTDYATATKSVLINVKASTSVSTPSSSLNPSTYGQAVTLTAAVTSSAGTPTGTVQFLDGTMSLGTVALSSGSASITTAGVSAGARSITAVYSGDANFAGSTSPPLAQTVNKASTTSAMTVSQAQQQYSDLVTLQATLTPASIAGQAPATGAIFSIGSQQLNTTPVPLTMLNGVPTAILSNYALLETVTGQLQPGIRSLSVTFTGVNANFTVSNVTKSFSITREDARTYYTGPTSLSTASSSVSTATIPLRATIKDITAVTGDPSWDSNPGNIGLAQVSFVNRATGATIGTATLAIVPNPNDPNDKTVATATYNWNVDIGTATSQTFTVGTVVTGYYTRNSTTENATITVSKAH